MKNLLKNLPETGVLIIGDLIVDRYLKGTVERISPEAPVPVVEVSDEELRLGGATNVANNISSLGGKVFITGVIGNDGMGNELLRELQEKGINTDGIVEVKNRFTTVKTRVVAHNRQQVVRFDKEMKSDISKKTQSLLLDYIRDCLAEIRAIIIADYCKGVVTKSLIKKLLELTRSRVFVAVDPKIGHFDLYKGVSIITPNVSEASFGSGINITDDDKTLRRAGDILLKKLQTKAVLITRGDKGMTLFEERGKISHIPTFAKEVYDVTGAGDTVIAAFTLYHAAGASLKEAAEFANHAAGIVVGEAGTAVVTPEEIKESIRMNKKIN